MMDFDLGEEQLALQVMVRKFTEHEIEPIAARIDREARLPDDLITRMAGVGLFGIAAPRAYGGTQAGKLNATLACEQIAYSGTGAWWLVGFNNSVTDCIAKFGSEELKQKYIRPLCEGLAYPSVQFTEEETGSDPKALTTTAIPEGKDYIINGMKRFSSFGDRNGYAVVYAKDETGQCSAFIIEKNGEGYSVSKVWELMGGGGMEAADVYFRNLKVPAKNLLGKKSGGFDVLLYWIALEKVEQCGACVGMAQAAFDEAVKYAKSRIAKGKPISGLQGIRWMLADMKAKLQAARLVTYQAAFMADRQSPGWQTEAATAKLFVVPATIEIAEMSRRIHGAYGYTREFKIEMICRAIAGATGIATSLEINRSLVGGALLTD
jgi:alkylation response protein AidB-like acyl-CoA dehydrogenase